MLKSMTTIVFAIGTAAVLAAVADTNAVVATGDKRQPAVSANVVTVAPVGDTAFDRAVRAELKEAAREAKEEYKTSHQVNKMIGMGDRKLKSKSKSKESTLGIIKQTRSNLHGR